MRKVSVTAISLTCLAAVLVLAAPAAGQLEGVWVTTSGSVDTSSTRAIVKDLIKPQMTDEQKALAIFNWYRRVVFPHRYLASDRRDLLRQINSYGNTLCGSHAANMSWLMREAGFKTRITHIPGHSFIDVFFDGGWHTLDSETDFAVWSRGEKPHLISMEELAADPTLLDNAIEEGRARPWFFKAMRHPWTTRRKMAALADDRSSGVNKMDLQWSSCVLKGETIKDFFVRGAKKVKHSKENATYGGHISDPNLMKLTLRPHERLVRRWSNEGRGKWIIGEGFQGYPAHLLYGGGADESDPEVFPYVEPYRKDNYGLSVLPVDRCYRYSGNGRLVWSPDIAAGELTGAAGVKMENVTLDKKTGVLRPTEPGKLGTITVPFRSSYALVWADIKGTWLRGDDGDVNRITVWEKRSVTDKASGKKIWQTDWFEAWRNDKTGEVTATAGYGKRINRMYNYQLRVELLAAKDVAKVGLKAIAFDHTFANNWLVLPHLAPGRNTVRVRLANPEFLKQAKLTVTYRWAEGAGWKTEKEDTREVTGSPFEYELTAAGPKFPRMKELILEALPR